MAGGGQQTIRFRTAAKTRRERFDLYFFGTDVSYRIRRRPVRVGGRLRVKVFGGNAVGQRATISLHRVLGTPRDSRIEYHRTVERRRVRLRKSMTLPVPPAALATGSGWVYVVVETKAFRKRVRDPQAVGGRAEVPIDANAIGIPVRLPR